MGSPGVRSALRRKSPSAPRERPTHPFIQSPSHLARRPFPDGCQ
ncbi:hypothetical protein Tco_1115311, partial [Tanacetum coccineum]